MFSPIEFSMKAGLPQRQTLIIKVIFQALSNDDLKNKEKGVQQGQKSKKSI